MSKNSKLQIAKNKKDDEFYTQYEDIKKEIIPLKRFFENKTVYLPCDDYEKSNFTKFFLDYFDDFKIEKLISTSYAYSLKEKPNLFNDNRFLRGKILIKTKENIYRGFLKGDGDFRSRECTELLRQSDIVVTNPPYSLLRKFIHWSREKDLILVAPIFCATNPECFRMIMNGKIRLEGSIKEFIREDGSKVKVGSVWLSSFASFPEKIELIETYKEENYKQYDNYKAIDIERMNKIPKDYYGVMGVPVSFLSKYNPEQFELLGITDGDKGFKKYYIEGHKKYDRPYLNGKRMFSRVLIQRRKEND